MDEKQKTRRNGAANVNRCERKVMTENVSDARARHKM